MNFSFMKIPIKLINHEWLRDNGLNYNALVLWSHLLYHCSWHGESWITMESLFSFIGIETSRRKPSAWDEFLMAMTRFKADGFIDYNEDLNNLNYKDHVTVKINESMTNGKWQFVPLPSEAWQKIRDFVPKEVTGEIVLAVYLFIGSHFLDDGWCYYGSNKIGDELHLNKTKVTNALNWLTENNLIRKKVIKNKVTGKQQNLYSPNSAIFSNKTENI